jgi:hypothetical protein
VAFVFCQAESCAIGKKLRIPEFALPGATMPPSERAARHVNRNPYLAPQAGEISGEISGVPGSVPLLGAAALPPTPQSLTPSHASKLAKQAKRRQQSSTA